MAAIATVAGAVGPRLIDRMAGVYRDEFGNALVFGETYQSENIVEIVKVAPDAAYVRAHLEFYNGHLCGLAGVARVDGDGLTYRTPDGADGKECRLHVSLKGRSLVLNDDGTCKNYCGARGSFLNIDLPAKSRRPIRYMGRLLKSREYRDAMTEFANRQGQQ